MFSSIFTSILIASAVPLTSGGYLPSSRGTYLPTCSYEVQKCVCPRGTSFATSSTEAVIGANAADVTAVTGHFFSVDWEGTPLLATEGKDNIAGAVRNISVFTGVGLYTVEELLTEYIPTYGGGFLWRFQQYSVPTEFTTKNGSFGGYWVTINSEYASKYETSVSWTINSCFTGSPIDFKGFKEGALKNATSILKGMGQLKGKSTNPSTTSST